MAQGLCAQEVHMKMCLKMRWVVWLSLLVIVMLWTVLGWAQQPRYGGTLRLALEGDPAFYNANQGPAPGGPAFWTGNNIWNSLLTITPPPELKIVPDLAKSWEVLDGGKTYVFHLEEGVKFHDGTDFDAEVAKWNIDRILDPEVKSWVRPYYEEIDKVEVVDKYTLRIHMKGPSGALLTALGGYFQGIPMISPKAFETYGKDWLYHPVGTGPYIFKEWVPGKHVILEKNPNYFRKGLPYIDTLEFRIMKDPLTASTALRAGEIDFITRMPIQQVPLLEKSPGIKVITGPELAPTIALLNMRVKPLDDVRARRAVGGYGINRVEIAKVAFQGRATPLVSVVPPGVPDAIDLNEMYPYKPDEAKRLLKELGFDNKNPLKFTILTNNQDATFADMAALVKEDFDMAVNSFGTLRDINQRSVSFFKGQQSDYMGINDPSLEEMVRQWRRTLVEAERRQISADMQRLIAEQLYWVNVTGYPFFQAYRDTVQGYPFYNTTLVLFGTTWLAK